MASSRRSEVPLLQRALDASREVRPHEAQRPGIRRIYNFMPPAAHFLEDTLRGLTRTPKSLSWKHWFDPEGSRLYERASGQPENLAARNEKAILTAKIGEIVEFQIGRAHV